MGVQIDWLDTDSVSNYTIAACPCTIIDLIWDKVKHILELPINLSHGEATLTSTYNKLKSGESLLITISDKDVVIAVCTIEVRTFESGIKALYIPLIGGKNMNLWMDRFIEIAKGIAKDFGCTELRGIAVRKGWMRKLQPLGWEEVSTVIKYNIGE